ncbi:MAG: DUF1259 domain-containing protein [Gammaproteobacteria bacterium]
MNTMRCVLAFLLFLGVSFAGQSFAVEDRRNPSGLDPDKIEKLTGAKGKLDATGKVFKVSLPRTDLAVAVAGVKMIPAMGLTSWAAFQAAGNQIMLMGDIVLREDQVNPTLSAALESGIEVTALHNHFLWDTPKVMFMHIGGLGDLEKLATGVGRIFEESTKTGGVTPQAVSIDTGPLDPEVIETVIGVPVEKTGDVYKITIGRSTTIAGMDAGKSMGVNTWAAFAGSNEKAVVDGDFAMLESELQRVLKALRDSGIFITAIHHHMIGESPKIVLLHYWGLGSLSDLARAIKTALDTQEGQAISP